MHVAIYQIDRDRDESRLCFRSLDRTCEITGQKEIDASIYNEVFDGDLDAEDLEDVFIQFNTTGHPLYRGRSLSVSDVLVVNKGDGVEAYFCDSIGFANSSSPACARFTVSCGAPCDDGPGAFVPVNLHLSDPDRGIALPVKVDLHCPRSRRADLNKD